MIYIVTHYKKSPPLMEGLFDTGDLDKYKLVYDIAEVPKDCEKYYYHFDCHVSTIFSLKRFAHVGGLSEKIYEDLRLELAIPERVKDDVEKGICTYLLDQSLEGFWTMKWEFMDKILQCSRDKWIWLSGDFNCTTRHEDSNVDARYLNWWERNCSRLTMYSTDIVPIQKKQIQLIEDKKPREFYNTFLNRRVRDHRIALMLTLHKEKLLDDMIWSWGGRVDGMYLRPSDTNWNWVSTKLTGDDSEEMYESFQKVFSWGNEFHNKERENLHKNLVNTINGDDIYKTDYQLIVETHASKAQTTFLSEKVFKPFMLGQPFVLWGDPLTIDCLQWHGYDAYHKWIDHSYDTEWDPKVRVKLLTKEIKRLNEMSQSDWAQMLWDMRDVIISNMKNLNQANSRWGLKL